MRRRLEGVSKALSMRPFLGLIKLEKKLKKEWMETLLQEEILWMQKSRVDWLRYGDKNTNFFHTSCLVRRRRNRVETLQDDEGNWIEDAETLKNMEIEYLSNLFRTDNMRERGFMKGAFPQLDDGVKEEMRKELTVAETKRALWEMGSYKAPGPDSYQAIFFKRAWSLLGEEVHMFVKDILEGGASNSEFAQVLMVLISKKLKPVNMKGFRPISLCNTMYKLVPKILVNRLKDTWKVLISPFQTSFVP